MTRKLLLTATFSMLLAACGFAATPSPQTARNSPAKPAKKQITPELIHLDEELEETEKPVREVGDFVVQRYTGSFRKTPLMVSEEVVARDGEQFVVEYTIEEASHKLHFRARVDAKSGELESVAKLEKDKEIEMSRAAFEALMNETAFAADSNEERLASEQQTCLVGAVEHDCETTTYRVKIGNRSAKLKVTSSASLPGRDISGEVVADDGTLLYRAEIVEIGRAGEASSTTASRK